MGTTLFIGLVASALGFAYMIYGKRQARFMPFLSGLGLCLYSYFIDSWVWLCVIGGLLLAAPFFVDF